MTAPGEGPYLSIAVVCEQIIRGKDGRITVVNVLDQVTHTSRGPDAPDEMPPFTIEAKALIVLRAGSSRGRFAIKIQPEDPSGEQRPSVEIPIQFGPGNPAAPATVALEPLTLEFTQEGLHWIDVFFVPAPGKGGEDQLLTRIPLTVVYQPQKTSMSG